MSLDKSFFSKVYDVVRAIPHGRITTYGLIANYLGSTNSARMVGYAMKWKTSFCRNKLNERITRK